jgi:hypothetical protein
MGIVVTETVFSPNVSPELLMLGASMMGFPGVMVGASDSSPYAQQEAMSEAYEVEQRRIQVEVDRVIGLRYEKSPVPERPAPTNPTKIRKTRAQKRAERKERENARRRALVNTDLRVIDRQEYRKREHPVDREVREGMEYLGLNR